MARGCYSQCLAGISFRSNREVVFTMNDLTVIDRFVLVGKFPETEDDGRIRVLVVEQDHRL